MSKHPIHLRANLFGHCVELASREPAAAGLIAAMLVDRDPVALSMPTTLRGLVYPYDQGLVSRSLRRAHNRVPTRDPLQEIFAEEDRLWLTDERWGATEVNLLKGQWRSWLHPNLTSDVMLDHAICWPMAQLLERRGVHLIPAVSVVRDGWGCLILSPYDLTTDLARLTQAGYRVMGARWTAVMTSTSGITLHRGPEAWSAGVASEGKLTIADPWFGCRAVANACDCVVVIQPTRRERVAARQIGAATAQGALRSGWPMYSGRRPAEFIDTLHRLMDRCAIIEGHLSRNPADLLDLLMAARYPSASGIGGVPIRSSHAA